MKTTFKNSSLFALGMVAVALLTSGPLTPVRASVSKTIAQGAGSHGIRDIQNLPGNGVLLAGNGGDGQESHGDKGKTHGG